MIHNSHVIHVMVPGDFRSQSLTVGMSIYTAPCGAPAGSADTPKHYTFDNSIKYSSIPLREMIIVRSVKISKNFKWI